jgi:hypothetical protein
VFSSAWSDIKEVQALAQRIGLLRDPKEIGDAKWSL